MGEKKSSLILAVLLLAFALRLGLAWTDTQTLRDKILFDDPYIELSISRNIAQGHGISFDGVTQTSSFQPLWVFIGAPFYAVFDSDYETPIHALLTFSAIADTLAVFFIYKILKKLKLKENAALAGVAFYAFNPFIFFHSLNGLITGVQLLLFSLAVYLYLLLQEKQDLKKLAALGVVLGLIVLARLDGVVLAGSLGLFFLAKSVAAKKTAGQTLKTLAAVFAPALLVVAPWFALSFVLTGNPLPVSLSAQSYFAEYHYAFNYGEGYGSLEQKLDTLARNAYRVLGYYGVSSANIALSTVSLLALAALGLAFFARYKKDKFLQQGLNPFVLYVPLIVLAYVFASSPDRRYFAPAALLTTVFATVGYLNLAEKRAVLAKTLAAALFLASATAGYYWWESNFGHDGNTMYAAAVWLRENTGNADVIGVFNPGIAEYYSDRTVIDMSGYSDNTALQAYKQNKTLDYGISRGVKYLADFQLLNQTHYAVMGAGYPERLDCFLKVQNDAKRTIVPYNGSNFKEEILVCRVKR